MGNGFVVDHSVGGPVPPDPKWTVAEVLVKLGGRGATLATTGDDAWHGRQHFKIFANVNDCCNRAMRAPRRARGIAAGGRKQRGAAGRSRVARRAAQPRTARRLRICMLSSLVPWPGPPGVQAMA